MCLHKNTCPCIVYQQLSHPAADEVSVLSAEDFRCRDALGATWESRPRRWWCELGTWSTTSTASPALPAARCSPPGTTLAWKTVWCTVGCTLRLSSRENMRHILTTRTWCRTKAWARPTRSDYPTSAAWGRCRKEGRGRGKVLGQGPSWLLIMQVKWISTSERKKRSKLYWKRDIIIICVCSFLFI